MHKKSEKTKKNATLSISPDNLQGFISYLENLVDLVEKIVNAHNLYTRANETLTAPFDKKNIDNALKELLKFEKNITIYLNKYQPTDEWEDLKTKLMIYLIELNNVLQYDHFSFAISNINSDYKARTHLEMALHYVEKTIKYRDQYIKHKDPQYMLEPDMKREEILELLKKYQPFEATNEIDKLLVSARKDQDLERAYETFKKACELAGSEAAITNNYSKQFNILLEQADFYFLKNKLSNIVMNKLSAAQIDRHYNCILKSSTPLILASMLIIFNKPMKHSYLSTQSPAICHKLSAITKNFLALSKRSKDLDKRITFLTQANKTLSWSNQLIEKLKYQDEILTADNLSVQKKIKTNLDTLKLAKEKKTKEEADEKIQALEMAKCIAEYEEKFEALLKTYDSPKKEKSTVLQQKEEVESWISEESSSLSEVEVEVENETPQAFVPSLKNFDLDHNAQLLKKAKEEKDISQQIYIGACIGEFLQWRAARHLKKKEYNNAIDNLKNAIIYFTSAHQLISNTKSSASHKEIWLRNLLQTTDETLSHTLKKLRNIEQRFEYTRLRAKQYIIRKYGEQAWFKPDQIGRPLSKNAQILQDTKEKIILLERMQKEFQETFQIQPAEPQKIASALIANSAICRPTVPVPKIQETSQINSASLS